MFSCNSRPSGSRKPDPRPRSCAEQWVCERRCSMFASLLPTILAAVGNSECNDSAWMIILQHHAGLPLTPGIIGTGELFGMAPSGAAPRRQAPDGPGTEPAGGTCPNGGGPACCGPPICMAGGPPSGGAPACGGGPVVAATAGGGPPTGGGAPVVGGGSIAMADGGGPVIACGKGPGGGPNGRPPSCSGPPWITFSTPDAPSKPQTWPWSWRLASEASIGSSKATTPTSRPPSRLTCTDCKLPHRWKVSRKSVSDNWYRKGKLSMATDTRPPEPGGGGSGRPPGGPGADMGPGPGSPGGGSPGAAPGTPGGGGGCPPCSIGPPKGPGAVNGIMAPGGTPPVGGMGGPVGLPTSIELLAFKFSKCWLMAVSSRFAILPPARQPPARAGWRPAPGGPGAPPPLGPPAALPHLGSEAMGRTKLT
mmetsp:Transcript_32911/g.83362  ORF Transcript_32911/g.83362 Transcript_32911/m.83362 type:complete len:421 (+) Transcript_32911:510-1772(+)